MNVLSHVLAGIALMAGAVIYGTDVFCAIVQRPALALVDDRTLTSAMGRVHQYGDRRLPVPGALSIAAAVLAVVTAGLAGHAAAAAAAGVAVAALVVWLIIYLRISAPVNRALTAAAASGHIPPDARSLQRRWELIRRSATRRTAAIAAGCSGLASKAI